MGWFTKEEVKEEKMKQISFKEEKMKQISFKEEFINSIKNTTKYFELDYDTCRIEKFQDNMYGLTNFSIVIDYKNDQFKNIKFNNEMQFWFVIDITDLKEADEIISELKKKINN